MFYELLPRISSFDPHLEINYLITGKLLQQPPIIENLKSYDISFVENYLRPRRYWLRLQPKITDFYINHFYDHSEKDIFHTSYFSDIICWKGKKIVSVYDMVYEIFPDLFNSKFDIKFRQDKKRAILNADSILCISESTKNDLINLYNIPGKNINVVTLGTSTAFYPITTSKIPKGDLIDYPFILYVGKRSHNKNFKAIFEAFRRWPQNKDVHLIVVGEPWSQEEEKSISQTNLDQKIHLCRYIDDNKLCFLYNQALGFVYPSIYEGFGLPLLEAMSCGCSIIASNIPSTVEVAQDIPFYFNCYDIDSLIYALDQLFYSNEIQVRKQKGYLRTSNFSWDKSAQKIIEVYKSIQ